MPADTYPETLPTPTRPVMGRRGAFAILRRGVSALLRARYRTRVVGARHVPARGPALLVANHMSMVDPLLIGASAGRFVRFLAYAPYFRMPVLATIMRRCHAIPVSSASRQDVAAAIEGARHELEQGHVVCIFAEGAISRTGNLLPFRRGLERIARGLDVPVIPVHLDGVWGSIFSYAGGRFFWKRPRRRVYPVTVSFGSPLPPGTTTAEVRMAISALATDAARGRRPSGDLLHTSFMRIARRRWRRRAIADSTGLDLTYGRALVGALALGRAIRRRTPGEDRVGLLLPASVGGALANLAVLCAGRTPVNLNFTIGAEAMAAAIGQAGIRTVVTSKRFLSKAGIAARPDMVCLEDIGNGIGARQKLAALLEARLLPFSWLARRHGGAGRTADSLATVIFSSGSTGVPKGVMITHRNILANVDSLTQLFPLDADDGFIGVLPFFHAFGLTGTLWFPLLTGCRVVYHPNPTDAKAVGELAATHRVRMLMSTPTFCQSYIRRCTREQFSHLKYAVVGAEKLREPVARAFREKFGVALLEGYGCTEMAPVIAVNCPDVGRGATRQVGTKPGSVGHPIPGVAAMVVDRDTGAGPLVDREGLLLVKGPNMMAGYLNQPERTAEAIRDGWYVTGDIARIDEDGFIHITDRLSRFSKVGGEMVPHLTVEDAINGLLGEVCCAVTAVPDDARGERLVAFYARPDVEPGVLWERLCRSGLPKLWLPRRDALVPIAEIPTLGTGKVDLRRLRDIAAGS
jgi:acyl-[acyl-carrier-protein]-phospholipid O-acyltransferase/long-chain-fatty-acid--[acyl-carrier-protein] ligase